MAMNKKQLFNAKNAGLKIEKGMQIEVVNTGSFPDVDKDGHDVTVVALESKNGDIYTTISGTIAKSLNLLDEVLKEEGSVVVQVNESVSSNGREFFTLQIVG